MSKTPIWKIAKCFHSNLKRKNTAKILKLSSGLGLGCAVAVNVAQTYDEGDVIDNVYGIGRFLRSLKVGLWISIDYYFSMMGLDESSPNYRFMMSRIHQRAADNILQGCLLNGGSYIKLGQGLVSMSHILPREYISTLKALQDKCLKREKDEVIEIFMNDFGKAPSEVFAKFEEVPIAAASIAQVFKAETKDNQKVAVKVQYKDLQARFKSDVVTIKALLSFAGWMHPNFNFAWVIDDLVDSLKQELDFVNEARNSQRCAKDLRHFGYIHVPQVFWEYTNTRILVTEFIDGYKISDVDNLKKDKFSLADINRKLFEAFGHQIFQTGFVHADPHPGNNHILFAEVLTQAPLRTHGFKLITKLTEEDEKRMTEFARDRFDSIMDCIQSMPRSLLLVLRNLNTIRSISHDHGSPIDRYSVLARMATQKTYSHDSLTNRMVNIPLWMYFEFLLGFQRICRWFRSLTLKILQNFGLAPDIEKFMSEMNFAL
ncbi:unnamed protein product [Callosobruchus maculatus]|uniref:ABC1 atypical kinase-like domain-containing protein n=1 Tax=Callosobruchus maculatus TaxID=64391 RepID=A0A653DGV1_CALMS|nr:unnamed protein product [Callosobruchus maculatus]